MRLALRATLQADAVDGLNVRLRASYRGGDQAERPYAETVVALGAAASAQVSFNVDVSSCLADRDRIPQGRACVSDIDIELRNGETVLDAQRIPQLPLIPGQLVENVPSVSLSDLYTVEVSPAPDTLILGESRTYSAVVRDRSGAPSSRPFRWSVSNPAVASIDANTGVLASLGAGNTSVAATLLVGNWSGASQLSVVDRGRIVLATDSVRVSARVLGPDPAPVTVTVSNASPVAFGALSAQVSYLNQGPSGWLTATIEGLGSPPDDALRLIDASGPDDATMVGPVASLRLSALRGQLAPGTYVARVDVSAVDAINSPQSVVVTFTVTAAAQFAPVTPPASFTVTAGQASPAPVDVAIAAAAGDALGQLQAVVGYTAPDTPAFPWLEATLAAAGTPTTATLLLSTDSLEAGTYLAEVRVTSPQAGNSAVIPVELQVVAPPGELALSRTSVSLAALVGGAVTADESVEITNAAATPVGSLSLALRYPQAPPAQWLTAELSATDLPATLTFRANPAGLPVGEYVGELVVSAATAGNSPQVVTVTLVIGEAPPAEVPVQRVAAGNAHTCALDGAGVVSCTGSNGSGQLGDGTTTDRLSLGAVAVPPGADFVQLSARGDFTCALTSTGVAYCWGSNSQGQLGDGTTTNRLTPVPVESGGLRFVRIASGSAFTCALTEAGVVSCWGGNADGQLGDGTTTSRSLPAPVAASGGVSFVELAAGSAHACALTSAGAAYCWGLGSAGQLGDGSGAQRLAPVPVNAPAGVAFARIAAGGAHTCGITASGSAYCWGSNFSGQLGTGIASSQFSPGAVAAPAGVSFVRVSAGGSHSCAVTTTGAAYCWGENSDGRLGDGTTSSRSVPILVSSAAGVEFAEVFLGVGHSCAVATVGAISCWGNNSSGRLGDGTALVRLLPVPFGEPAGAPTIRLDPGTAELSAVVGGGASAPQTVLISDEAAGFLSGLVVSAPSYPAGQPTGWLSVGALAQTPRPARFTLTAAPGQLDAGTYTASVSVSSTQPGVTNSPRLLEVNLIVSAQAPLQALAVGGTHSCVLTAAGGILCNGLNTSGQLGNGTLTVSSRALPVTAPNGVSFAQVATGDGSSCAVTTTGAVYCWGNNAFGQLGDGSTVQRTTPTLVATPDGVTFAQVAAAGSHSCAVSAAGNVFCWGSNTSGQLGDGSNTARLAPVPIAADPGLSFVRVATGGSHSCAWTTTGAAYCWGNNSGGRLGDGTTTSRNAPVEVNAPDIRWVQLGTGGSHSCGVSDEGLTYCWGSNGSGELGDGTFAQRTTPVPVAAPVGVSFAQVAPGSTATCAVSTAGAAYCWGSNTSGQLGDGTTTGRQTPVLVAAPPTVRFAEVQRGLGTHSCGRTVPGTVYCWGFNQNGQVGDGTVISPRTAPVLYRPLITP